MWLQSLEQILYYRPELMVGPVGWQSPSALPRGCPICTWALRKRKVLSKDSTGLCICQWMCFLVYLCLCLSLCYSEQMLQLSLWPVDDHRSSSALAPSTWLACWLAYFHILCFVKVFRYKIFSLSWFFMERFLISFVCFRILNRYSLYIS